MSKEKSAMPKRQKKIAIERRGTAVNSREISEAGSIKRLSIDLPEETHRRFKAACAASGRKMAEELIAFIDRRTEELERKESR